MPVISAYSSSGSSYITSSRYPKSSYSDRKYYPSLSSGGYSSYSSSSNSGGGGSGGYGSSGYGSGLHYRKSSYRYDLAPTSSQQQQQQQQQQGAAPAALSNGGVSVTPTGNEISTSSSSSSSNSASVNNNNNTISNSSTTSGSSSSSLSRSNRYLSSYGGYGSSSLNRDYSYTRGGTNAGSSSSNSPGGSNYVSNLRNSALCGAELYQRYSLSTFKPTPSIVSRTTSGSSSTTSSTLASLRDSSPVASSLASSGSGSKAGRQIRVIRFIQTSATALMAWMFTVPGMPVVGVSAAAASVNPQQQLLAGVSGGTSRGEVRPRPMQTNMATARLTSGATGADFLTNDGVAAGRRTKQSYGFTTQHHKHHFLQQECELVKRELSRRAAEIANRKNRTRSPGPVAQGQATPVSEAHGTLPPVRGNGQPREKPSQRSLPQLQSSELQGSHECFRYHHLHHHHHHHQQYQNSSSSSTHHVANHHHHHQGHHHHHHHHYSIGQQWLLNGGSNRYTDTAPQEARWHSSTVEPEPLEPQKQVIFAATTATPLPLMSPSPLLKPKPRYQYHPNYHSLLLLQGGASGYTSSRLETLNLLGPPGVATAAAVARCLFYLLASPPQQQQQQQYSKSSYSSYSSSCRNNSKIYNSNVSYSKTLY
ncbi:hypothetical protein AND_004525 [Anopheles darlingi]|uniref:Uncharacterized protein n=1 Tax=Anopheles darlingi TaxID=43151 RepID=W5JHZ6_ANODA|nr:hypothetical protein AND_004525 [Anopheles darlingi]